jgi:hypothetical protein
MKSKLPPTPRLFTPGHEADAIERAADEVSVSLAEQLDGTYGERHAESYRVTSPTAPRRSVRR